LLLYKKFLNTQTFSNYLEEKKRQIEEKDI